MGPPDLIADFYLYPSDRSGRRGALGPVFPCMCLTKTEDTGVWTCRVDVGPEPMRPGERRRAEFRFEAGAEAAARLRAAGTFYLRHLGIMGEATIVD